MSWFFVSAASAAPPAVTGATVELTVGALLGLAFLYGLLHALDADHVAAITVFASRHPRPAAAAWASLRWGIGHTGTLLGLGVAAIALGMAIPEDFERYAELAVGIVLCGLGVWLLKDFVLRRIHLHAHAHRVDRPGHMHLHAHEAAQPRVHGHRHSPMLVGLLHGAAGSAGALVLIPVAAKSSVAASLLYLACFSGAIVLAMVGIGVAASVVYGRLLSDRPAIYEAARAATGAASVVLGVFWVAGRL